jgi:hypothetical protein
VPLHALLFLTDETPHLVQFDPSNPNADHAAIVKLGATLADLKGEVGNSLAINVRETRGGALANAFAKRGDDLDLLLSRKDVHCHHHIRCIHIVCSDMIYRCQWQKYRI